MTDRELMQQIIDAWDQPGGINYYDLTPYMDQLRERLARHEPKAQKHEPRIDLGRYAGTYGGYVTEQPARQEQEGADEPDEHAWEKRPENCGTSFCSCIECPYEPARQEQEK